MVVQSQIVRGGREAVMLRVVLGVFLRRLRESAGITPAEAAAVLGISEARLARLERGELSPAGHEVRYWLALCRADTLSEGALHELVQSAAAPRRAGTNPVMPQWLVAYVGVEEFATRICAVHTRYVPGLLQTLDYATAVLGSATHDADERAALLHWRMLRQQPLTQPDAPPCWVILDEAVLRRCVGDQHVMAAQVYHLLEMSARPRVCIQVLQHDRTASAAVPDSFTLLDLDYPGVPHVVCVEFLNHARYITDPDAVDPYRYMLATAAVEALNSDRTHRVLQDFASSYRTGELGGDGHTGDVIP